MPIELGKNENKLPSSTPPPAARLSVEQQKVLEEKSTLEEERLYRRGVVTVRDIVAPAAFQVTPNHLLLSGVYVRTIFVITYPRYIGLGWSASIINLTRLLILPCIFIRSRPILF